MDDKETIKRLKETAKAQSAVLHDIIKVIQNDGHITLGDVIHITHNAGLQLSPILNQRDWYEIGQDEVISMLLNAEMTEKMAAYYLNTDVFGIRDLMEATHGVDWRDKQK